MTQTMVDRCRQGEDTTPANVAAYAVETDNFAVGVEPVRRLPPTESLDSVLGTLSIPPQQTP